MEQLEKMRRARSACAFPLSAASLTHSAVLQGGVVNPALGLLHLPLQIDGGLGRPAVGHGLVGLGLQVLQRRSDLLGEGPGFGSVALPAAGAKARRKRIREADMAARTPKLFQNGSKLKSLVAA